MYAYILCSGLVINVLITLTTMVFAFRRYHRTGKKGLTNTTKEKDTARFQYTGGYTCNYSNSVCRQQKAGIRNATYTVCISKDFALISSYTFSRVSLQLRKG